MSNSQVPEDILRLLSSARAYSRQGQVEAASELHETITQRILALFGAKDLNYARSLSNLGLVRLEAGDFDRADSLLRQAFEITNAVGDSTPEDRATAANNLAGFYQQTGQDVESLPLFEEALELERTATGESSPGYAQVLSNIGLALTNLGRYAEAEFPTIRALEIRRGVLRPMSPEIGQSLNNLGLLYEKMGRYSDADRPARESISIYREALGQFHPTLAISLANLALLQQRMARGEEAGQLFEEALAIALQSVGEIHPLTRAIIGNFGMLHHDAGRYSEAKKMFEAEVSIASELQGASPEHLGMALNHLGLVQLRLGEYSDARESIDKALRLLRSDSPESELLIAAVLNNRSLVDIETGHYAEAEASLREVCNIRSEALGIGHPDYELAMYNLASCLIPQRRFAEAAALLERAAAIDDLLLEQVFSISSEEERLALTGVVRQRFERFLCVLAEMFDSDVAARLSAFDIVLRRKCIVLDAGAAQRHAIHADQHPELRGQFADLSELASEITRMVMDGPGSTALITHQQKVAELRRRAARIEADLSSMIPEMRAIMLRRKGSRNTVASSLPDQSAMLEFVRIDAAKLLTGPDWDADRWNHPRYLCFVLLDGVSEDVYAIDLGDADEIDEVVAGAREAMIEEGLQIGLPSRLALRSAGLAIFDPVEKLLGGRKRLIISPDGDLSLLPFETLLADSGQQLVDEYTFSYLTNARDIQHTVDFKLHERQSTLILVDPDYDLKSESSKRRAKFPGDRSETASDLVDGRMHFTPIPGTREEGERIGALLKTAPIFGAKVLERFVKATHTPRILHLATHGFFVSQSTTEVEASANQQRTGAGMEATRNLRDLSRVENPLLRSGLALAGANTWLGGGLLPEDAEDGLLTSEDVSGLNLFGTELVVLSACDTGLGQVQAGEGVFGLRRAFALAGARTVVMSLWQIPDKETVYLMEAFYGRLLAGDPPSCALREAQLAMKARQPKPFFWGAFICQGDDRPLSLRSGQVLQD